MLLLRLGLHLTNHITPVVQQYSADTIIRHGIHRHATNKNIWKITLNKLFNDAESRRKTISKLPFEMSNLYHVYETHAILTIMLHRAAKREWYECSDPCYTNIIAEGNITARIPSFERIKTKTWRLAPNKLHCSNCLAPRWLCIRTLAPPWLCRQAKTTFRIPHHQLLICYLFMPSSCSVFFGAFAS